MFDNKGVGLEGCYSGYQVSLSFDITKKSLKYLKAYNSYPS